MLVRDGSDDKAVLKAAGKHMYELSKLPSLGMPGLGVKVEAEQAGVGVVIPQATMFAPHSSVETLGEITDFMDDPQFAVESAQPKKEDKKR